MTMPRYGALVRERLLCLCLGGAAALRAACHAPAESARTAVIGLAPRWSCAAEGSSEAQGQRRDTRAPLASGCGWRNDSGWASPSRRIVASASAVTRQRTAPRQHARTRRRTASMRRRSITARRRCAPPCTPSVPTPARTTSMAAWRRRSWTARAPAACRGPGTARPRPARTWSTVGSTWAQRRRARQTHAPLSTQGWEECAPVTEINRMAAWLRLCTCRTHRIRVLLRLSWR